MSARSPGAASVSARLREAIARHAAAGRTALVGRFEPVSYQALGERIDGFADAALKWGVRRGEVVGIATARNVDTVALFLGLMQAGACPCVMEPRLAPDVALLRMRAVGMKRLVVDRDHAALGSEVAAAGMTVGLAEMKPVAARRRLRSPALTREASSRCQVSWPYPAQDDSERSGWMNDCE